jgi:type II restriction enzyme
MSDDRARRVQSLVEKLYELTGSQINWIEAIVNQFSVAHTYEIFDSDLFNDCMLDSFGDALLIHHCMSKESFSKDKFEYVLERVANFCGNDAEIASRGNPGHDITINGQRFSLKTQADRNIREGEIHISKFMELGQGQWGDDPEDLIRLREQFFRHMNSYSNSKFKN